MFFNKAPVGWFLTISFPAKNLRQYRILLLFSFKIFFRELKHACGRDRLQIWTRRLWFSLVTENWFWISAAGAVVVYRTYTTGWTFVRVWTGGSRAGGVLVCWSGVIRVTWHCICVKVAVVIFVNHSPFKRIKFKIPLFTTSSSDIFNGYFSEAQKRFVICNNDRGLLVQVVAKLSNCTDNRPELSIIGLPFPFCFW